MAGSAPPPPETLDDPIGTSEIARTCRVAPRTVAKWIDSGLLPGWRLPGGKTRRTTPRRLLEFLQHNNMPIPPTMRENP